MNKQDYFKAFDMTGFEFPEIIDVNIKRRYTNEEMRMYVSDEKADKNMAEILSFYDNVIGHKMEKQLKNRMQRENVGT